MSDEHGNDGPEVDPDRGQRGSGPSRGTSGETSPGRPSDATEAPTVGPEGDGPGERITGPLATIGGTWGHLEILRELGKGEFGEVYQCRDPSLDMIVALKLIRRRFESDEPDVSETLRTFLREGRFMARVRHPNVITVHGAAVHDGLAGIWMEYLRGKTLSELVKSQGLFGAREAAVIGADLCRALAAVHGQGLIHRDVKSQNVIREEGGRIVLMDFGAGRDLVERTENVLGVAGTPLYMAPETVLEGVATARSDLYSLGILLFHLTTGTFPLTGSTIDALVGAHEERRAVRLRDLRADLPTGFVRAVEKAIAHDPADRFHSAGEMEQTLESQGETSISWDRASGAAGASSRQGAAPWILLGLGALALLTFLGTITSSAYRLSLGIPAEFQPETVLDQLVWGLRALIPALASMVAILAGLGIAFVFSRALWWSLEAVVPAATVNRLRRRLLGLRWKLAAVEPRRLARGTFAVGLLGLAALLYLYYPHYGLLETLVDLMSEESAPTADVSVLGYAYRGLHFAYMVSFSALILLLVGGLWGVSALTPEDDSPGLVDRGLRGGIVALVVLAAVIMVWPWRLLAQSEGEPACYEGRRAYIIGERAEDVLVYFPEDRRTRIIDEGSGLLEREAERRRELIFGTSGSGGDGACGPWANAVTRADGAPRP